MSTKDHPNNAPGVPMKVPVWAENFQIKYLNPIISPIAKYLPGMAVISHRGRTSGTAYETVVTPYRAGDTVVILLDNFPVWQTQIAAQRRDSRAPGVRLESSGGLSLDTAAEYAGTGVDYLAVGALTHSVRVLDVGLDL